MGFVLNYYKDIKHIKRFQIRQWACLLTQYSQNACYTGIHVFFVRKRYEQYVQS